MNDYLRLKKVCTRWASKLFTPLQRTNRVECCEEFLENCKQDPTGYFDRIVMEDETWTQHYHLLNQQEAKTRKKAGEKTPTLPRVTQSASKIIITIFWDCEGILLVDFLPRGTTINGRYYASLLHRLLFSIQEKRCLKLGHGVLLLDDNAPVHKFNVTQAATHSVRSLHRIESSWIFSRSCTRRLSSVLKSEEFSSWQ